MASRHDTSGYRSFEEVSTRFDEIIKDVRSKDTSLERSLDLFDEAIALGSRAIELVERTDFSPEEKARLADAEDPVADPEPAAEGAEAPEGSE